MILSHSSTIRVRYAETDKMQIVYNANYLIYFEIGRTELLRAIGLPYAVCEENGFQFPVAEASVQYLKPARYDDELFIKADLDYEPTKPYITIKYEITRNEDVIARGMTKHPFFDIASQKPIRPPALFRNCIEQHSV